MKLKELMDHAYDEVWIKVKDGDETHFFWSADYIGGHPDVMPELEPLLERTFDEYWLEYGKDPENPRYRAPVLCVELNDETDEDEDESPLKWYKDHLAMAMNLLSQICDTTPDTVEWGGDGFIRFLATVGASDMSIREFMDEVHARHPTY